MHSRRVSVAGSVPHSLEFFKQHDAAKVRNSTREREARRGEARRDEAMFLEFARSIKAVARMPIMVNGGFRTLAGMEAALAGGHTDTIGLARPFRLDADFRARMFAGQMTRLPVPEDRLVPGKRLLGPNRRWSAMRALNNQAQGGWYDHQIERLGADRASRPDMSPLHAPVAHFGHDFARAMRREFA